MSDSANLWERRRSSNCIKRKHDYREAFMRDECRVVHSFGFRRLQGKTQAIGPEQGDFHRNRMTHSIEVASISRSISLHLRNACQKEVENESRYGNCLTLLDIESNYHSLISTIGLLHDIGHPPFGHGGEAALNYKMRKHGGFEGNAQTLHQLSKLDGYTENHGLDLTRRTLLGLIKYPVSYKALCGDYPNPPPRNRDIDSKAWKPPKCYYYEDQEVIDWLLEVFEKNDRERFCMPGKDNDSNSVKHKVAKHKSFDCSIMDIADDITNSIHDLEDAIYFGIVALDDLTNNGSLDFFNEINENQANKDWGGMLFSGHRYQIKDVIGNMIDLLISEIDISVNDDFKENILKYNAALNPNAKKAVVALKKLFKKLHIDKQQNQTIVIGGMITVMQLFDALIANPKSLLPEQFYENERGVCNYISGMTDEYARRLHGRIYGGKPGYILQKL